MITPEWEFQVQRGTGNRDPRPPGFPTPCGSCPRESPAREAETTIKEKNVRAFLFWQEVRESNGAALTIWAALAGRQPDRLTYRVLQIVGAVVRDHELSVQLEATSLGVLSASMRR